MVVSDVYETTLTIFLNLDGIAQNLSSAKLPLVMTEKQVKMDKKILGKMKIVT